MLYFKESFKRQPTTKNDLADIRMEHYPDQPVWDLQGTMGLSNRTA